jgi:membrane protein DedA with SNARE-associated domain
MIESLILFLQVNVLPLGALGVFLASVIEEVVAPIPSALIMTMSGFLLVSGPVSVGTITSLLLKVALPAALGVTVGSYVVYFEARYGGKFVIEKWGKYIGLYWSDIEKLQNKLSGTKSDELLIAGARVLPIVPSVAISAFCGIIGMNAAKYFLISLVGTFLRGIILGSIGWQVGNVYARYAKVVASVENIVLLSTVFIFIGFVVLKYKGKLGE